MNGKKIKSCLIGVYVTGLSAITNVTTAFATADASTVTTKVNQGLTVIQGILTGIIAAVGVIAATKVIIAKLPSMDDPHVKNEMWKAVGGIIIAVAIGGSLVWLVPWAYSLLQ